MCCFCLILQDVPDFIEEWSTLTGINTPTFLSEPDTEETFNKLTWRLAVDYAVNDDVLLFASYARGFKGGEVQGFGLPWQLGLNSRIIAPGRTRCLGSRRKK